MTGVAISRRMRSRAALTDASCSRLLTCEELAGVAAKELAAFLEVVNQDFGPQRAHQAADDWLQELVSSDCFVPEAIADFRQISIAAAHRLVHRESRAIRNPMVCGDGQGAIPAVTSFGARTFCLSTDGRKNQ
jgi:hypothetical protein